MLAALLTNLARTGDTHDGWQGFFREFHRQKLIWEADERKAVEQLKQVTAELPEEAKAEVREIERKFIKRSKSRGQIMYVDYQAMLASIEVMRQIMAIYDRYNDDEEAILAILLSLP